MYNPREQDAQDAHDLKQSAKVWNATNDRTEQDEVQLKYDELFVLTTEQPKHVRPFPFIQICFALIALYALIVYVYGYLD